MVLMRFKKNSFLKSYATVPLIYLHPALPVPHALPHIPSQMYIPICIVHIYIFTCIVLYLHVYAVYAACSISSAYLRIIWGASMIIIYSAISQLLNTYPMLCIIHVCTIGT